LKCRSKVGDEIISRGRMEMVKGVAKIDAALSTREKDWSEFHFLFRQTGWLTRAKTVLPVNWFTVHLSYSESD
jgi:hypothetical protein